MRVCRGDFRRRKSEGARAGESKKGRNNQKSHERHWLLYRLSEYNAAPRPTRSGKLGQGPLANIRLRSLYRSVFPGPAPWWITLFSALVTLRGRSVFDTQKPLDLSMSIFRPCCAEATATNRNITAIRTFVGFILIIWIREMFRGYVGFVRDYLHGLKSP
jgi:hypothetical protein